MMDDDGLDWIGLWDGSSIQSNGSSLLMDGIMP